MGEFNGKIVAEFTPPKTWELEKSLAFKTDDLSEAEIGLLKDVGVNISSTGRITCKKGMKTDLASVPRIIWNFISPWDVARAATIHDHLYATLRRYFTDNVGENKNVKDKALNKKIWSKARALSDKVFLLGMRSADPKVPSWKVQSAHSAVRLFGYWPASKEK
tara:strand:- start:30 stop:518 length:489 start_codon:yes stop_codon:yes gene_type:complete